MVDLCGIGLPVDRQPDDCLDKHFKDYVDFQHAGMIRRDVFAQDEDVWATYEAARDTYSKATAVHNEAVAAYDDALDRWNKASHTSVNAVDDYIEAHDAYEEATHTHGKAVKSYRKAVEKYIKDSTNETSMGPLVETMSVYRQFAAVLGVLATVHLVAQ